MKAEIPIKYNDQAAYLVFIYEDDMIPDGWYIKIGDTQFSFGDAPDNDLFERIELNESEVPQLKSILQSISSSSSWQHLRPPRRIGGSDNFTPPGSELDVDINRANTIKAVESQVNRILNHVTIIRGEE